MAGAPPVEVRLHLGRRRFRLPRTLSDDLRPGPRSRWLRALVVLAAGLALLFLLHWRESGLESFERAFAHVRWNWALASIAFNLLSAVAGSLAWDTVVKQAMPPPHPRYRHVLSAFAVGLLGNVVLPGRAGEVARVAVLARRFTGPVTAVWAMLFGTVVAFRLLDLLPSLALIGYVLVAAPIPHWAYKSLLLVAALGIGLLGLGVASARRYERPVFEANGSLRKLSAMARQGLGILRAPAPAVAAALYQSLAWLSQLLAVFATLRAFGIELPLSAAAVVLALVNLAILFPFWPGNVGVLQAAVALPLVGYGIDYGRAIAFGVGLQAIEVSVGVSLGLLFLTREGLSVGVLRRTSAAADGAVSAGSQPLEVKDG